MKRLILIPLLILSIFAEGQTVRTKSYFQSLFNSNYRIKASDLKDLSESIETIAKYKRQTEAFTPILSFNAYSKFMHTTQSGSITFSLGTGNLDDSYIEVIIDGDGANSVTFPPEWINQNGQTFDNTKRNRIYFGYDYGQVTYSIAKSTIPITDVTPPVAGTASTNPAGTQITIPYNESLNTSIIPATTAYVFTPSRTVSSVNIVGVNVVATVSPAYVNGDAISFNYTSGTNKVQDLAGNVAVNLTAKAVTNNVPVLDNTPPSISSAATNLSGDQLTLTYNEALNTTITPALTDYVLSGSKTITGVIISGSTVNITFTPAYVSGNVITITYAQGTNKLQDLAGNFAINLTNYSVTNSSNVIISDDFTRANNTSTMGTTGTGQTYTYPRLIWGIDNNQGYCTNSTGGAFDGYAIVNAGVSDFTMQVDITPGSTNSYSAALYRYTNTSNHYRASVSNSSGTYTVEILKLSGGAFTSLGTYSYASSTTSTVKVVASGNTHNVYINGNATARITATDAFNNTATSVGLYSQGATGQNGTLDRFDNLTVR